MASTFFFAVPNLDNESYRNRSTVPCALRVHPPKAPLMTPTTYRLLSFVFLAAVLPILALWALLMKVSTPNITGGMEPTVTTVCYFALTFIAGGLITVCVNFSRQLARQAKGQFTTP